MTRHHNPVIHDTLFKLFTAIFGIGHARAKEFIAKGWSSIQEVRDGCTSSDWRIQWGLAFHEDLTTPVTSAEADYILGVVRRHVDRVLPGAVMELTGGFRRLFAIVTGIGMSLQGMPPQGRPPQSVRHF